jgi:hypothetical protein
MDLDLRPVAWVAALTVVLLLAIRVVERYAHTAAARRTQRAIAQSLRSEGPPRSSGAAPLRLDDDR